MFVLMPTKNLKLDKRNEGKCKNVEGFLLSVIVM